MNKILPVLCCTPVSGDIDGPLIVFTANLVAVYESKRSAYHHSNLVMAGGEEWKVKESPEDILRMLCTDDEDDMEWAEDAIENWKAETKKS